MGSIDRWLPKDREHYYFTTNWLEVRETEYRTFNRGDENLIKAYNCFKTKDEAEEDAKNIIEMRKKKYEK